MYIYINIDDKRIYFCTCMYAGTNNEESGFVTYEELFYCTNAATQLSLDFQEVRVVRYKLQVVSSTICTYAFI
jgi:hypothetical protein